MIRINFLLLQEKNKHIERTYYFNLVTHLGLFRIIHSVHRSTMQQEQLVT